MSRLIDRFNPAITLLVAIWVGAFSIHEHLIAREALTQQLDYALRSLLYVVPIMLVGWALLAFGRRLVR